MTAWSDMTVSAGPSATRRPSAMTATQSEMWRTTCMSCSTNSTVMPSSRRLWMWPSSDWVRAGFTPAWSCAPSIMLSITVIRLRALVSWKVRTMPALATLEAEVLSSFAPSKDQCAPVRAEVGLSKPVIRLKNVVLPAPLGPISAVITPRCTSRWSTSTAVMPPNARTMWSTTRMGSGLAEPGLASTVLISSWRTAGSPRPDAVAVMGSDIEPELPLVAENPLRSEDHDQHQRDADHDVGELLGLLAVHDAVRDVGVGDALDHDPRGVEQDRTQRRAEDRGGAAEQQGGVAEEREGPAHGVRLHRRGQHVEHAAERAEHAADDQRLHLDGEDVLAEAADGVLVLADAAQQAAP